MENILTSIIVAVITALLSVLGTLFVQRRKNKSTIRKSALYLYLNLKQTKADIDKDKKGIDGAGEIEIMPMNYFNPFDYIGVLSELKGKLSDHEIEVVNNFFEKVKKIDSNKMFLFNVRTSYNNFQIMNPALFNPYEQQYKDSYNAFERDLNTITNSDEYKGEIVEIISKLRSIKDS